MRETYQRHLCDDVLAWWLANGPDPDHGGVLTCWDNAGERLVSTDKYTWSQGRWAWLATAVARAADEGVLDVDPQPYRDTAVRTAEFVMRHALLPDGTSAYVTDRQGTPGEHLSVFADLFAALGFAGVARLGDPAWGELADDVLASAAERIRAGSYRAEPYPVPQGHRSFALPMILVGVGENVHRATGSAASADVVRDAAAEVARTFRDGADIVEMPGPAGGLLTRHRTPGHVLEALWFLHHAGDLVDGWLPADLADVAAHALTLGWDTTHGGLLRYTDRDGGEPRGARTDDGYEALVIRTWDIKLWWPHAEALYTTALLGLWEWHERLRAYTFGTFPAGPGQEWVQIRNRRGEPLAETVALPVKDPFHVARALLLLVQMLHDETTEVR
ncbi:MAG: N-acylglucosamine 2-epimerase [Streptosporangiales bacterium]|nr:N-acylglucosamine 2-epimerase [Streptosporangiales bacterium]